jgi:hypothetical protein
LKIKKKKKKCKNIIYHDGSSSLTVRFATCTAMDERSRIRMAMDAIESKTCLRFVDKNDGSSARALQDLGHAEHLYIVREHNKGCYAMIGYHRDMGSPHMMNLEAPSCIAYQGTVQHELLHVVGLLHEQARNDRDKAVTIYWENIDKGKSVSSVTAHANGTRGVEGGGQGTRRKQINLLFSVSSQRTGQILTRCPTTLHLRSDCLTTTPV